MRTPIVTILVCLGMLLGCRPSPPDPFACAGTMPPPGSNEVLRAPVRVADGLEVIIADVYIPPGTQVPRHYHPGEEFLYVLSGSSVHVEEGQPDLELAAGDAYVIPPEAVHSPIAGPEGARAVVFRLHVEGKEERYAVP